MITPTQDNPTLILRAFIIVGKLAGITTLVNICFLFAPKVFNRVIFSSVSYTHLDVYKRQGIGSYDPHIWLDPIIVIEMAKIIKDVFSEVDKENQNYYEENFNIFQSKLYELDKEYNAALSRVKNKNFIVSHGAFGLSLIHI